MQTIVPHHLIELFTDCLLKSIWYKDALKTFLRRNGVKESVLATLDPLETKRVWIDRLVPALERTEAGRVAIMRMANELANQVSFPGLERCEDSATKITTATVAVQRLKLFLLQSKQADSVANQVQNAKKAAQARQVARQRTTADLNSLRERFESLSAQLGTQQGGYQFQDWFYDLMEYFDIDHRKPYSTDGRQIDGSISIDGTSYLIELKFTASQSDATDVDSLRAKVEKKSDNTMGILLSVSGFSKVAIAEASYPRSPLLLFDHAHLYLAFQGEVSFSEIVRRVRRHSSQEGKAYLPVNKFGG